MEYTILRMRDVSAQSGFARSTIYEHIAKGLWTKPVSITPRAVGWPKYEVDMLIAARISGQPAEAIKALVNQLEKSRDTLYSL